jgi:hypothetical protein
MEGYDLKNIYKELREAGVDPEDLEQAANYFMKKDEGGGMMAFNNPIRNIKGLTVGVLIRTIEEKKSENTGKQYYEYRLMVCTFEDVVVPSEIGEKINENAIRLRVEKRTKMSLEEREEYLAGLKPAERNSFAGKREYAVTRDEMVTLFAGTEIKITSFDGPFTHSNKMPFATNEFAICKGLICEETITVPGQPSKFGKQWKVQSKVGTLEEDTNKGPEDIERMMKLLERDNQLVNVGDNNPKFTMDNESEDDTLFRKTIESAGKDMKDWQKDTILLGFLPKEDRSISKRSIIINLNGTAPDPEFMAQREKVIFKPPTWGKEFVGTKKDDVPVKLGAFQARCLIMDGEKEIAAVVQVQMFDKHMTGFGVMDYEMFGKIAASYVPRCRGYIAARMNVGSSHAMDESSTLHNKQNEDGTFPKGVEFGVFAYAELLNINLASGVIDGGFGPLTAECAAAIMEHKYQSSDFSEKCPTDVDSYAKLNPLNSGGKPPIVNMLEARHSVADLKDKYQFYMVCDKQNEEVSEAITLLQTKYPDTMVQKMSDLILGRPVKGISGWTVKLYTVQPPLVYTIFAIKNDLVESTLKLLSGEDKLSEAEFTQAYVAAVKKRKADEERAQAKRDAIANAIADAEQVPAGTFDDPPAKKQKVVVVPPDEEQSDEGASFEIPPTKTKKKVAARQQEEQHPEADEEQSDEEASFEIPHSKIPGHSFKKKWKANPKQVEKHPEADEDEQEASTSQRQKRVRRTKKAAKNPK